MVYSFCVLIQLSLAFFRFFYWHMSLHFFEYLIIFVCILNSAKFMFLSFLSLSYPFLKCMCFSGLKIVATRRTQANTDRVWQQRAKMKAGCSILEQPGRGGSYQLPDWANLTVLPGLLADPAMALGPGAAAEGRVPPCHCLEAGRVQGVYHQGSR